MFKSKWQKKYEQAMETIEFWKKYHDEQIEKNAEHQYLIVIHTAQKIELVNVLNDMKRIAES